MTRKLTGLMIGVVLLGAGACAGSPAPTEQMASAQAAVRASKELGAANVPQAQLHQQLAVEQIDRARKLMEDGENTLAKYMLQRAKADAELSVALAREESVRNNQENAP